MKFCGVVGCMESDEVRRGRRVEVTGSDAHDKVLKVSAVEVRHVQAKRVRFLCEEKKDRERHRSACLVFWDSLRWDLPKHMVWCAAILSVRSGLLGDRLRCNPVYEVGDERR